MSASCTTVARNQPSSLRPPDRWILEQQSDQPWSMLAGRSTATTDASASLSELVARVAAVVDRRSSQSSKLGSYASRAGTEYTDTTLERGSVEDGSPLQRSPPSLTKSGQTAATTSEIRSVATNVLHRAQVYRLGDLSVAELELEHGQIEELLRLRSEEPLDLFPCPFYFLGCNRVFLDEPLWRTHAAFHFEAKGFPKHVVCPLRGCDKLDKKFDDGAKAWSARMSHMADHHRSGEGWVLKEACEKMKQKSLFEHLWSIRILGPMQRIQLYKTGSLTEPTGPFVAPNGRRHDR